MARKTSMMNSHPITATTRPGRAQMLSMAPMPTATMIRSTAAYKGRVLLKMACSDAPPRYIPATNWQQHDTKLRPRKPLQAPNATHHAQQHDTVLNRIAHGAAARKRALLDTVTPSYVPALTKPVRSAARSSPPAKRGMKRMRHKRRNVPSLQPTTMHFAMVWTTSDSATSNSSITEANDAMHA